MPKKKSASPTYASAADAYCLKITLLQIKPPIWRRIQVPSSIKLCCLHSAFQVAMGWTDSHLHQFDMDGDSWGVPEYDECDDFELIDEGKNHLSDLLRSKGDTLIHVYDFGDDWRHEVVFEKIVPVTEQPKHPICLGGERRCPPEDVGGTHGYMEFLDAIIDPKHEEHERMVVWGGGHFIDQFDLEAANQKLRRMRWPIRHRL